MARGKPAKMQLDMVSEMLNVLSSPEDCIDDGIDVRNYGELAGIPSARRFWADILDCKPEQTFIGGSSSLNFMFDVISRAYTHGLLRSPQPWCKEEKVNYRAYDRGRSGYGSGGGAGERSPGKGYLVCSQVFQS